MKRMFTGLFGIVIAPAIAGAWPVHADVIVRANIRY
jgi:hypothetical protein